MMNAGILQRIVLASPRWAAVVAVACAVLFPILAAQLQSLTMDEPYHLLAGYDSLRYGRNTVDYAHPPLVKTIAALPLLLLDEDLFPPSNPTDALADSLRLFEDRSTLQAVTVMSRGAVLLAFGLPFLVLAFALGNRMGGRAAGVMLVLMLGCVFPVFPYLGIVQTDIGAGVGFLLALVGAVRYQRSSDRYGLTLMGLGLGVALATKHSGVLLLPTLAIAVWLGGEENPRRHLRAALRVGGVLAAGVTVLWLSYLPVNRSYDRDSGRAAISAYCQNRSIKVVDDRMRAFEPALLRLEAISPAVAQWWTGFIALSTSNRIGVYPSFLLGDVSSREWWYYFPLVLLFRVPLAILAATIGAAITAVGRRPRRSEDEAWRSRAWIVLATATAVYLGVAMTSTVNLGIRHLLPIIPLLFLPAAVWGARSSRRAGLVGATLVLEAALVAPFWMSATNTWFLGTRNPTRFALWAADQDYGQSFKFLNNYCRANGIDELHVFYPGIDQRWLSAYVPGGVLWKPGDPAVPGWYAVSTIVEQLVPAVLKAPPDQLHGDDFIRRLASGYEVALHDVRKGTDLGYHAGTFHVYRVQPGTAASTRPTSPPAAGALAVAQRRTQ